MGCSVPNRYDGITELRPEVRLEAKISEFTFFPKLKELDCREPFKGVAQIFDGSR